MRTGFKYPVIMRHVQDNVGDYLHGLLTIGQYWNKDRPLWGGDALGGFEAHNAVIGGVWDALGVNGFLANRETGNSGVATGPEEEMMDHLITAHLERTPNNGGTVFRVLGVQPPPEGHELHDCRVISIREVLDVQGIALDGAGYTVDDSGNIHYTDKCRQKLPKVIASLSAKDGVGGLCARMG